ncbi:reverse transcriptase/maturase family protein [Streptomyces chiangmaiensis]
MEPVAPALLQERVERLLPRSSMDGGRVGDDAVEVEETGTYHSRQAKRHRVVSLSSAGGAASLARPTGTIRSLLEAYYEPQFSDRSHGFRPGKGCHTALTEVSETWRSVTWFVEGDISQCFDRLDHGVLHSILAEDIHDSRFLRLIDGLLQAGYLEEWRYHETLSGAPQGVF